MYARRTEHGILIAIVIAAIIIVRQADGAGASASPRLAARPRAA